MHRLVTYCCNHVPTLRAVILLLTVTVDSFNGSDMVELPRVGVVVNEEGGTEQMPCSLLLVSSLVRIRIQEGKALVEMG